MIAFERYREIEVILEIIEKHRMWLKDYEEICYSIAEDGKHKMKWKTEKKHYHNNQFSPQINCIGRKGNRLIIEFDGEESMAKEYLELTVKRLKELGYGFIRSTHEGKSDYLWIEFNKDITDIKAKKFLYWIAPKGSEIDLNMASSNKVFPILFAVHWKHSYQREIPIEFFEGNQIDYDELNIKGKPITKTKRTPEGFKYQTAKKIEQFDKAIKFFTDKRHLAEQFIEVQPLYYDNGKLWWIWNFDMACWEMVDETDIMNYISKNSDADTISSKERTEILEALKQVSRKHKPLPIPSTWIQFKKTIYDVKTGEQIEAKPKYFVTNPIDWEIGESEETPMMDKLFEQWVGKDHIKTLYQIIAYCLLSDYPIHRIFCFIGEGLNGKGTFLRLLTKFIGEKNCSATELDLLLNSRFEVTRLYKKLVCQMGETNFSEMRQTSIIKKLVGRDLIGFEFKNKTPFEDWNYAKIIISTNNLPTTTDKTIGFYRRWMIIDFPNRFDEKKDVLATIPEEEYNALAKKCLLILKDLLKVREFHKEGTIEDRMEKYEAKSNFLAQFIKENVAEDLSGYVTCAAFYKKFCAWSKVNRHREMSETAIGLSMKRLGYLQERKHFDWLFDGKGGQARVWGGIKWII